MPVILGLDAVDIKTVTGSPTGATGAVPEEVMSQIWDISRIPLPFMDAVGTGSINNNAYDWITDKLVAANGANKWVDTAEYTIGAASGVVAYADSATAPALRYRNHSQIMVKAISVSELAQSISSVGGSGGLEYNLIVAQKELKRDMEARCVGNYASVAPVAATGAGETASYVAGCHNQTVPTRTLVDTAGTQGGYNTGTFVFDILTIGAKRAITEAKIRDMAQALYIGGCGGPDFTLTAMCAPAIKRVVSTYFYTSGAKIASFVKDVGGVGHATAQGSVEYFQTDFGLIQLVPNRFMVDTGANQFTFFMFDPSYFELVYVRNVAVTANAKLGLVDRRTCSVYWGTRFNPECMGLIADIDDQAQMTA